MVTVMIFINLWAQRVGLLTRFWGSLGIALGAAMIIILPVALLGIVLWFMALGMMLLGIGRGGRPPAWEAGVAIPWVRPGDEPPDVGPEGTVEGSGRDVSAEEADPETNGGGPKNPPRKRKRRE
jgi:hypothetical protein